MHAEEKKKISDNKIKKKNKKKIKQKQSMNCSSFETKRITICITFYKFKGCFCNVKDLDLPFGCILHCICTVCWLL